MGRRQASLGTPVPRTPTDAIFYEDDIFSPPSFDEKIYYDESMPPIWRGHDFI